MIISNFSQFFYDGHQNVAVQLSNATLPEPCPPSERLLHLVQIGLAHEPVRNKKENSQMSSFTPIENVIGPGLDLEFEIESATQAPEPAQYETAYVTSHKGNCRAGAFSADGQLIATGSVDASIKILDVD